MLQRPEGLVPNVRRTRELHQDEYLQDAWLRGEIDSDSEHDEDAHPDTGANGTNDNGTDMGVLPA